MATSIMNRATKQCVELAKKMAAAEKISFEEAYTRTRNRLNSTTGTTRTFEQAVGEFRRQGLKPAAAVRRAVNEQPDLHAAYLARVAAGEKITLNFEEV